jgi:hypothetical protein
MDNATKTSAKEPECQGTEDLSERSAKNMFRKSRRSLIAGEEPGYSSESGNEFEDINNSRYDHRLVVPADKRKLVDWEFRINKIRQHAVPQTYIGTTRYDEMMVDDFKLKIAELRQRNASLCVLDDAANRKGGPGGQDVVSNNFEKPIVL